MNSLNAQKYLSGVIERLKQKGFNIKKDIEYNNHIIEYAAKKTKFEIERFGLISTFFLFSRIIDPDIFTLRKFSSRSYEYARKGSIKFLPRGLFYGFLCIPVAIVESINPVTAELIKNMEPPRHFAASEKLVVFSLKSQTLTYCESTFAYGSIYFELDRKIINENLYP
jgi:hypothetical protein